ncbi:MFS transporter [Methanospirillum lacunae]|uniref:MFS transporter n=1 Tax=Methanospirillum lacunae TaxID=668570 RepID=A0A2V2MYJ1_9EURY|nr:MFS transporter [Methanospirillum lacunae]PWR71375.1 MFS transporter [Methanospirillum lacunae]
MNDKLKSLSGDTQLVPPRNRHLILLIILACGFIGVVDIQIVSIALPTITHLLNASVGQTQWIATSYVITVLCTVLLVGTISAGIGKGRILKAGILVFTISSLACGLSTTLGELIFFRILQGLGASLMMSVLMALIIEIFPPHERGRAMGLNTAVIALGLIVGPSAGGFIVDTAGWPFIFFFNIPVGTLLFLGALHYLPADRIVKGYRFSDYTGAILLVLFMAALAMVFNTLANPPIQAAYLGVWTGLWIILFVAFILRERSHSQPLLYTSIFRNSRFVLPSISLVLYLAATFILLTGQPFYFQGVMGLSPSHVGLIALITPVTMILSAPLFGMIYDRTKWRGYTVTGLSLMGFAYFGCGVAFYRMEYLLIIVFFVATGIGRAIFQGPNVIEIMAAVPPSLQGMGSGLITTLMYLGIMVGISLTAILLTTGLATSGYYGQVLDADPQVLAAVFGQIMGIGGLLCLTGAVCSFKRKHSDG